MTYARLQMLRGSTPAAWACSVALASPIAHADTAAPARGDDVPVVEVRPSAEPEPEPELAPEPDATTLDPASPDDATSADGELPPDDAPSRSVFAPTAPPKPGDGVPEAPLGDGIPGGYWDSDKAAPKEPPDGDDEVLVGSIILPLGIISASSSAAMVWLSTPGQCQQRWAALDAKPDAAACKGVYAFGWVRITYGSLMIVTGAVLLGIGLHRRKQHEQWEKSYALRPRMGVGFASTGGAVTLSMRIGLRPRRDRRR